MDNPPKGKCWEKGLKMFRRRLILQEDGMLFRQMGYLIASGASVSETMAILQDESEKGEVRKMAETVSSHLSRGATVAESLAGHPRVFNETLIYLLASNHDKDKVSDFLFDYADEMERAAEVRLKLFQALIYPAKIFVFAVLILTLLMVFVVPVFTEMFADFHSRLPVPTRWVIQISDVIQHYFIFVVAAAALVLALCIGSKRFVYAVGMRLPGIRTLITEVSTYIFSKFLSLLLPLQRPLSESMRHAANMIYNPSYSRRIIAASENTRDLQDFKTQAQMHGLFPDIFFRTLAIGQRAKALDRSMAELARYFERRIARRMEIVRNLLEVGSIVVVGIMVGMIVISLYLPIFKLAGAVS
jgi:type IV pilus assembly protein PilC